MAVVALETVITAGVIGVVLGLLLGIMCTIIVYAVARNREQRRALRAAKRYAKSLSRVAQPDPWAKHRAGASTVRPALRRAAGAGGLADFMQDERSRPTFNPNPGPRDW